MATLYECLREARLDHLYPAFRANGIYRSETLITLGMAEFYALGITSAEDKRRLVELINIVKSVHNLDHASTTTPRRQAIRSRQASEATSLENKQFSGKGNTQLKAQNISNNRSSNYQGSSSTTIRLEPSRNVVVEDRVPNYSVSSYVDMLQYMSDSESESLDEESDEEQPLVAIANRITLSPTIESQSLSKWPNVERIKHSQVKGYNYGVHKVTTPTKSKSKYASQRNLSDEKIKVCVRKRPLTKRELKSREEDIVFVESTNTLVVNEPKLAVDLKPYTLQHEFMFDEVFDEKCSNEDVYIRAARPLINCVFNGGTATCFAYGQTGAGKTHTMLGNENIPGLYLLAGQDIFNIIHSHKYGSDLHVWVSFFEIYCGQLFDLLNKRNRLHVREDGSHQVCIAGLTETEAVSVTSLVQILQYGNSVRSKGATGVNPDSSRSHAILQLDIRNGEDVKTGKMSFIDLAGSERASDVTDTDKQTRMEGAEINQSLLALKECIRSIDQESRHTPFRQSKLTHILKDSFVGNSRTCMIANISPNQSSCENTINTLRYADRVKELKKDNIRSSSVGQAMNLLMNIPPNAPSAFHPSNILSSSTPQRQATQSRRTADLVLDPQETPIRGHNLPRRTSTKESYKNRNVSSLGPSTKSHMQQGPVSNTPAGNSARLSSQATAASMGALVPPPDASPSESDLTDTDSCNAPHPHKALSSRRLVAKSTDTEYEYLTSDFNDLNDLNRSGQDQIRTAQHSVDDQAVSAASVSIETVISGVIRAPEVKPVVYKSMDPGAEIAVESISPGASIFNSSKKGFSPSRETEEKKAEESEGKLQKSLMQELISSSDDSLGSEIILAEEIQNPNVLSVQVNMPNKNVLVPLPAESSDLTKFTQRASLRSVESNYVSNSDLQSCKSEVHPNENLRQGQDRKSPDIVAGQSRPSSAQSRSPVLKAHLTPSGNNTSSFVIPQKMSRHLPQPKSKTPDQRLSGSPQIYNTEENDNDQSHNLHSDPTDFRCSSKISQSPTGEHSDDSTDSAHQSLSDQGQGGYKNHRGVINMRKEKSDPMLALDMQRKKQTLPDPQSFSKILTRSSTPKAGKTNKEASWKVSHNEMSVSKPASSDKHSFGENMEGKSVNVSPQQELTDNMKTDVVESVRPKGKQLPQVPFLRQDFVPPKPNPAIVTEKLMSGAVFSPIHPQPVTYIDKRTVPEVTTSAVLVQPTPVSAGDGNNGQLESHQALHDERLQLLTSHEDQLATVTQLCKNEMRLLLNAKKLSGKKGFDEYIRRVGDILQLKLSVINSLHEEIDAYLKKNMLLSTVHSSVAVSSSHFSNSSTSHDTETT